MAKMTEGMRIEDGCLVIVKKLEEKPRESASGKSWIIASTNGRDSFTHEGKEIQVNLNAYNLK